MNNNLIIFRIKSKIKINSKTKCWNWQSTVTDLGYGQIWIKGKYVYVHRYTYWYYRIKPLGTTWKEFDKNNKDLCVCHKCDNRGCCNPKHLFLGTQKDNIQDCKFKGRRDSRQGELNICSKLTENDVINIRRKVSKGYSNKELSIDYGVTPTTISEIKHHKTWRHIE